MTPEQKEREDEEDSCQNPCHPDSGCPNCVGYWQHMINEGYWDQDKKRWTEKGWSSITRSI
jgi:hypothetical protein